MADVMDRRTVPAEGPSVWRGEDLQDQDHWIIRLTETHLAEIDDALAEVEARGLTLADLSQTPNPETDFPLGTLADVLADVVERLERGVGFVLIRGLPLDRMTDDAAALAYMGLGRYLGIVVSQNANGDLLGHVRDAGKGAGDTVRGYQSKRKLNFHNDATDVVGLLCLRDAKRGGLSKIVSAGAIHNAILERRPDLIDVLYEPFFYSWKGEQPEGKEPYYWARVYSEHAGNLNVRFNSNLIEVAQRLHPEVPRLSEQQQEALELVKAVAEEPGMVLHMDFQPGDMQFINNYVALHSRTEYEDHDEEDRKRHLLRLWLVLYQGRELADDFTSRYESVKPGTPRGGVQPRK